MDTKPPLKLAMKMADRFRDHLPTIGQIRELYGVSLATAYRWLKTLSEVHKERGK